MLWQRRAERRESEDVVQLPPSVFLKFAADQGKLPLSPKASPHLLIADDNALQALSAKVVLGRRGLATTWVRDGVEALRKLEQTVFDAVFVDIEMPGMSGIELAARIRAAESRGGRPARRTVIIGVLAPQHVTSACVSLCRDAGMDRYLLKPLVCHAKLLKKVFADHDSLVAAFRSRVMRCFWTARYGAIRNVFRGVAAAGDFAPFAEEDERQQLELIADAAGEAEDSAELLRLFARQRREETTRHLGIIAELRKRLGLAEARVAELEEEAVFSTAAPSARSGSPIASRRGRSPFAVQQRLEEVDAASRNLQQQLAQSRVEKRQLIDGGVQMSRRLTRVRKRNGALRLRCAALESAVMCSEDRPYFDLAESSEELVGSAEAGTAIAGSYFHTELAEVAAALGADSGTSADELAKIFLKREYMLWDSLSRGLSPAQLLRAARDRGGGTHEVASQTDALLGVEEAPGDRTFVTTPGISDSEMQAQSHIHKLSSAVARAQTIIDSLTAVLRELHRAVFPVVDTFASARKVEMVGTQLPASRNAAVHDLVRAAGNLVIDFNQCAEQGFGSPTAKIVTATPEPALDSNSDLGDTHKSAKSPLPLRRPSRRRSSRLVSSSRSLRKRAGSAVKGAAAVASMRVRARVNSPSEEASPSPPPPPVLTVNEVSDRLKRHRDKVRMMAGAVGMEPSNLIVLLENKKTVQFLTDVLGREEDDSAGDAKQETRPWNYGAGAQHRGSLVSRGSMRQAPTRSRASLGSVRSFSRLSDSSHHTSRRPSLESSRTATLADKAESTKEQPAVLDGVSGVFDGVSDVISDADGFEALTESVFCGNTLGEPDDSQPQPTDLLPSEPGQTVGDQDSEDPQQALAPDGNGDPAWTPQHKQLTVEQEVSAPLPDSSALQGTGPAATTSILDEAIAHEIRKRKQKKQNNAAKNNPSFRGRKSIRNSGRVGKGRSSDSPSKPLASADTLKPESSVSDATVEIPKTKSGLLANRRKSASPNPTRSLSVRAPVEREPKSSRQAARGSHPAISRGPRRSVRGPPEDGRSDASSAEGGAEQASKRTGRAASRRRDTDALRNERRATAAERYITADDGRGMPPIQNSRRGTVSSTGSRTPRGARNRPVSSKRKSLKIQGFGTAAGQVGADAPLQPRPPRRSVAGPRGGQRRSVMITAAAPQTPPLRSVTPPGMVLMMDPAAVSPLAPPVEGQASPFRTEELGKALQSPPTRGPRGSVIRPRAHPHAAPPTPPTGATLPDIAGLDVKGVGRQNSDHPYY
eukprot:TRINITY_DN8173_c1_g1_i1.p1 TRINITY_DN8173_c1_g1~~TRINITY_DN8173_c1_g1_i1.p1  ORF type:complete len:1268 (+),score=226.49 TRINITY_DN8173_c1_g1_i1:126-3929(+)